MIQIEKTEVYGWEPAIRGMRNPKNSWGRSDSEWDFVEDPSVINPNDQVEFVLGPNDADLMRRLCKGGPVHAKFRRMIVVYVDINAPFYWWKEFDTYKVGTVANSCSTMHKIHSRDLTRDDFSHEKLSVPGKQLLDAVIDFINHNRRMFIATNDKNYWENMIQMLPTSYNQKRTILFNYEVLSNMYHSRLFHKLEEWHKICAWIESLPNSWIITGKEP